MNAVDEYAAFRAFLEKACGIVLGDNKQYLVNSRLGRLMQEHHIDGIGTLLRRMQAPDGRLLRTHVIDAMTTNETSWFRDPTHFNALRQEVFPELMKQRRMGLRIWSAACSSGQEPYTLAITADEWRRSVIGSMAPRVEIVGTDIAPTMLEYAQKGLYCSHAIQRGLPDAVRNRYFTPMDDCYELKADIRNMVRYQNLNLLERFEHMGRFDIIFCRNVLIYFSAEVKRDIVERFAKQLNPGGYLFLSSSESLTGVTDVFEMKRVAGALMYQLKS